MVGELTSHKDGQLPFGDQPLGDTWICVLKTYIPCSDILHGSQSLSAASQVPRLT